MRADVVVAPIGTTTIASRVSTRSAAGQVMSSRNWIGVMRGSTEGFAGGDAGAAHAARAASHDIRKTAERSVEAGDTRRGYRTIRSAQANRDLLEVIAYPKQRWGILQAREYRKLLREAIETIAKRSKLRQAA